MITNFTLIYLDKIDKVIDMALSRIITQKQAIARNYIIKIMKRSYQLGDMVLRKVQFFVVERRASKV